MDDRALKYQVGKRANLKIIDVISHLSRTGGLADTADLKPPISEGGFCGLIERFSFFS